MTKDAYMRQDWYNNETDLNSFLGYRYVIDDPILPEWVTEIKKSGQLGESELVEKAKRSLDRAFDESLKDVSPDANHIISFSAGYDSRAILAELVHRVNPDNILCVTYGTPGGFNYELTREITKVAGVSHKRIDLTPGKYEWRERQLKKHAAQQETPSSLFGGGMAIEEFFRDYADSTEEPCYLWIGYLGGESGGAHLDPSVETWDDAIESFLELNYQHDELTDDRFEPRSILPNAPLCSPEILRYEEQLDYAIRQTGYIKEKTASYEKTPFAETAWLEFALNIPYQARLNQDIYRDMLLDKHPSLFELPSARDNGLSPTAPDWIKKLQWIRKIVLPYGIQQLGLNIRHPIMMHFDKNKVLRGNKSFIQFIKNLLYSLEDREIVPWINIKNILKEHQRPLNLKNYGWEIIVLASLEIHIRASNDR